MDETRQRLVIDNIPFANRIAYKKKRILPKFIDVEEIKSAAYMGLVDAASKFDENRGIFPTYAYYRISGAITDYLRELDWGKRGDNHIAISLEDIWLESKKEPRYNEFIEHVAPSDKAKEILRKYFVKGLSLK